MPNTQRMGAQIESLAREKFESFLQELSERLTSQIEAGAVYPRVFVTYRNARLTQDQYEVINITYGEALAFGFVREGFGFDQVLVHMSGPGYTNDIQVKDQYARWLRDLEWHRVAPVWSRYTRAGQSDGVWVVHFEPIPVRSEPEPVPVVPPTRLERVCAWLLRWV